MLFAESCECILTSRCSSQVPLDYLMAVLQKLERDYKQMRDKILAGVPLAQLKPLSVHSEEILTGACDVAVMTDIHGPVQQM